MQSYSKAIAHVYNNTYSRFAQKAARPLVRFYADIAAHPRKKPVLDLGCGTGQLATVFLEKGFEVIGVDLAAGMLHYARRNTAAYLRTGQARFIQANMTNFVLEERVGLAVSTFGTINHLASTDLLRDCFQAVFRTLDENGYFVFDIKTHAELSNWNDLHAEEDEDCLMVSRRIFIEEKGKAYQRVSGCYRRQNDTYHRFEQTYFNTVFAIEEIEQTLRDIGWRDVYFASYENLSEPIDDPESLRQVVIVAKK